MRADCKKTAKFDAEYRSLTSLIMLNKPGAVIAAKTIIIRTRSSIQSGRSPWSACFAFSVATSTIIDARIS